METPTKARRLKTIAAWINENRPELRATLEPWTTSTDTKVAGTRFRRQGKGRKGHRFKVYLRADDQRRRLGLSGPHPIFDHNSGETYRRNDEVERWLATYLADCTKGRHAPGPFGSSPCKTCRAEITRKDRKR